jgi:hypothetical protein
LLLYSPQTTWNLSSKKYEIRRGARKKEDVMLISGDKGSSDGEIACPSRFNYFYQRK